VPIDFSAPANRDSYAGREADVSWREAVRSVLDPTGPDDDEIDRLLADRLPADEPVVETDRWTLWTGSLRS
jgi:hypothetical protein